MTTNTIGLVTFTAVCFSIPVTARSSQVADEGATEAPSQQLQAATGENELTKNKRQRSLTLEEIIVTAQKREEQLQDVPISISVLRGEDLDRSRVQGITEALNRVPGTAAIERVSGGSQLSVRGVAAPAPVFFGSSPIAYYLDSVPFGLSRSAIAPDPNAYDLERVEVLRGPQGTLFGASALNGVVRVLTADANTEKFELKARTSASTTEGGGENYRGDLALNVPIIEGKLGARAVLGYQDLSGWIDRPNLQKKDMNDGDIRNMRLKINAQPTERLSVGLSAWISRVDLGAPSASDDNQLHRGVLDESIATDYDAFGLRVVYEFSSFSLTSMTSYLDYLSLGRLDFSVRGFDPAVFGDVLLRNFLDATARSQEVVINSTGDGPWRWSLGSIYRDSEDGLQSIWPAFLAAPIITENESESFAVFGEVTRSFLDSRLELTVGLRYFEDDVKNIELSRFNGAPPDQLVTASDTFDKLTPRVVLTWHPSEQMTLYTSYAEGFRSGMNQDPSVLIVEPLPALQPDTLENYELGAKASLWGGRAEVEAALYYMDWQDVQQSLTIPLRNNPSGLAAFVNGESASGMGFDFGLTGRAAERLELGVNFSWNDLAMDADVVSGGVVLFEKGDRPNVSPEYTVGASADYAFPVGGGGFVGRLSASGNYMSKLESRALQLRQQARGVGDSMFIARTSFSIEAPEHWTATLFVDNVNDEDGVTLRGASVPTTRVADWDPRVRPRTIGLQFDYRY